MDQTLANRRKEFNEAVAGFGLDKEAAESLWSYAASVGMQIDDFTLSILLYGAHQEKTARDAEKRIREAIAGFDKQLKGRLENIVEGATKETAASNAKIAAGLGGEIAKAVDAAVETRDHESRSRERRAITTAATLCVCGVLAVGGLAYATGYVSGRDNAVIVADRFEALTKDPAASQVMQVVELNDPGIFGSYCGRGSGNLREIEGRLQCTVPLWVSGDSFSAANYLQGVPRRTLATISNWSATSSAWLLVVLGAAGGLMLRKGLRNVGRLGPVRWLLDID